MSQPNTLLLLFSYLEKIREYNKTLGVYERCAAKEVQPWPCKVKDTMERDEMMIFINTKNPEKFLANAIKTSKLSITDYVYIELEQLTIKSNKTFLTTSDFKPFHPKLFIIDSLGVDFDRLSAILGDFKMQTIFVSSRIGSQQDTEGGEQMCESYITHRTDGNITYDIKLE